MVAQIHQFLEVIVVACSAITEIYYFGNCWKLFSCIDEHSVDKCMNSITVMFHAIRCDADTYAFDLTNIILEVNRKWMEGSLAVFPVIFLDSVLNQKAITFSKIKKTNDFIAIDLFFYCFKKAD